MARLVITAHRFSTNGYDTPEFYHYLNARVYEFILDMRAQGRNVRSTLGINRLGSDLLYKGKEGSGLQHLYEQLINFGKLKSYIYSSLLYEGEDLSNDEEARQEEEEYVQQNYEEHKQRGGRMLDICTEQFNSQKGLPNQVAVAAVALVGGHSALMDGNPEVARRVWDWSNDAASSGWQPKSIAPLRVYKYFADSVSDRQVLSLLEDLMSIAAQSRNDLNIRKTPDEYDRVSSSLEYHQIVLAHLTDTLASSLSAAKVLSRNSRSDNESAKLEQFKNRMNLWFRNSRLPITKRNSLSIRTMHVSYLYLGRLTSLGSLSGYLSSTPHLAWCIPLRLVGKYKSLSI